MGMEELGPVRASAGLVKMVGCVGIWSWGVVVRWGVLEGCGRGGRGIGKGERTYVAFLGVEAVVEAYAHDDGCAFQGAEELYPLAIRMTSTMEAV
jgi:hypothetical protein